MFSHWTRHYIGLGFQNIIITYDAILPQKEYFQEFVNQKKLRPYRFAIFNIKQDEVNCANSSMYCKQILYNYGLSTNDYWCIADTDEFFDINLKELISKNELCYYGRLIDRISETGELTNICPLTPIDKQYPVKTHLTRNILNGINTKVVLMKECCDTGPGHHRAIHKGNYIHYSDLYDVNHYKWNADLRKCLNNRMLIPTESALWKSEAIKALKYTQQGHQIDITDPLLYESPRDFSGLITA
jgi:hypothetical protein